MNNTSAVQLSVFRSSYLTLSKVPAIAWIGGLLAFLWFLPPPEGLTLQTWHLFAIFLTTIVSLIVNLYPMGIVCLLALAVCGITETLSIKQVLSAFSSNIIWLILLAFLLARGFTKTGLGARIAYYFILNMGKNTLGLSYGLITTEFLLAPFTPSNTARGGGIVYPIISSLAKEYNSCPKEGTQRRIGSYLMTLGFQTNVITSAMFLTATAGNPLIASLAAKFNVEISWTTWALAALVPGVINLAILPWVIQWLYPSEIKTTPEAPSFAKQKLEEMGPLSKAEWIMLLTFGVLLTLWVTGPYLGVDATVAALLGLSILLVTRVLNWDDIAGERNAWHTFVWLGTLLMLSSHLTEFGLMDWFGGHMKSFITTSNWVVALGTVSLVYFYSHYGFASITAHISAMFSAFGIVAIGTGAPPMLSLLLLAFLSSLCAGITHYGTGTAPVYYATEYVSFKDWWRVGGILSVVNLTTWGVVGAVWWKVLGLW